MSKSNRLFTTDLDNDLSFDSFIKRRQLKQKHRSPFKREGESNHRKLKSALNKIRSRRQGRSTSQKIEDFFEAPLNEVPVNISS